MSQSDVIKMELPSRLEHVDLIQKVAEELARQATLDDDGQLDVGLAVREGVINAVMHGNKCDAEVPVAIRFDLDGDRLAVEIRDRGDGFDPDAAPDPTSPENLWRTSGRGLLLIKSLVDDVSIESGEGGTLLRMVKKIEAASRDEASGGGAA